MPSLFDLLSQDVGLAGTGRMSVGSAPSGAVFSAGTDSGFDKPRITPHGIPEPKLTDTPKSGKSNSLSMSDILVLEGGFDTEGFESDPITAVSEADKGGFFDALIKIGAGLQAMGGDTSGAKIVAGRERNKLEAVREKRLQEASRIAALAKREDMRAKEVEMAGKVLDAAGKMDDPEQGQAVIGAALRKAEPGSYAAILLSTGVRDLEQANTQAAVVELVTKAGKLGYLAQAAETAGRLPEGTFQRHLAEMTDVRVIADKMRTAGELSQRAYNYLNKNPEALTQAANALGLPVPGVTKKAQETAAEAGAREAVKAKSGSLIDELGNIKPEAGNAIRAEAATVFGGLYDPSTGAFRMTDKKSQVRAQELSAQAAELMRTGKAKSPAEAVKKAREALGVNVDAESGAASKDNPAKPKTQADFEKLPSGAWFVNPSDSKVYQKK